MIFDKFCFIVERFIPDLKWVAEQAKIFVFDKAPHLALPKHAAEKYKEFEDIFALPFQVTAIEDPASLIIFMDKTPDAIGLKCERKFIEIIPWETDEKAFNSPDLGVSKENIGKMCDDFGIDRKTAYAINFGTLFEMRFEAPRVAMDGTVGRLVVIDKDGLKIDIRDYQLPPDMSYTMRENGLRNMLSAIEELLSISTSTNFILEEAPIIKNDKGKKIARSHQRPKYTILSPTEIRKKLDIEMPKHEHGDRKSPIPHERRRHYRRLSTEGGHYKENKIIVIPAMWVGQSEKQIGNKIYKVRLDI